LAASAATSFVSGSRPTPALLALAAVHGYTTAFLVSAVIFAAGAVITGLLYERGVTAAESVGEPVLAA
jgi:hypothetical protein